MKVNTSTTSRDSTKRCHWLQHCPHEYFRTRLKACNYFMQELQRVACNNCTCNHGFNSSSRVSQIKNSDVVDKLRNATTTVNCYRQHCAQRKAPVLKLLRGRVWGFSPRRGDTLHRWRWNLARRRGPKVPRAKCRDTLVWLYFGLHWSWSLATKQPRPESSGL